MDVKFAALCVGLTAAAFTTVTAVTSQSNSNSLSGSASKCGPSGIGSSYDAQAAVQSKIQLRSSPLTDGTPILNEKESSVMGSQEYHEVDPTELLRETCRVGEWSEVAVLEPEWLRDVKGWVPTSRLRQINKPDGMRLFTEADFYWDTNLSRFNRELVVNAVNKTTRYHNDCSTFDPGTLSLSANKSTPQSPVFFITCHQPNYRSYNVYFTL